MLAPDVDLPARRPPSAKAKAKAPAVPGGRIDLAQDLEGVRKPFQSLAALELPKEAVRLHAEARGPPDAGGGRRVGVRPRLRNGRQGLGNRRLGGLQAEP